MSIAEKILLGLAYLALFFLLYGIASYTPDAMHAETLNQDTIAAKHWHHHLGYYDYKQFTEANHGY